MTCGRSVVFSGYPGFLLKWNWPPPPRYSWNIFESSIKHHNPNPLVRRGRCYFTSKYTVVFECHPNSGVRKKYCIGCLLFFIFKFLHVPYPIIMSRNTMDWIPFASGFFLFFFFILLLGWVRVELLYSVLCLSWLFIIVWLFGFLSLSLTFIYRILL